MPDIKLLTAAVLLVLAVVAIAGCTGTEAPTATPTPTVGSNVSANNTVLPGSAAPSGTPPGMPNGTMPGGSPPAGSPPGGMSPGGSSGSSLTLSGTYTVDGKTAAETNAVYAASTADVSGVYVANGGSLTLTNPTVTKSGDTSSEDNSNFYGLNAGVVAASASELTIDGGTITTNADGLERRLLDRHRDHGFRCPMSPLVPPEDSSRGIDVTMAAPSSLRT